jgi:hypothetical protein
MRLRLRDYDLKDFDANYEHIKRSFFEEDNFGPDDVTEIDARLWLREMYLTVQNNMTPTKNIPILIISVFLAGVIVWQPLFDYLVFGTEITQFDNPNFLPYSISLAGAAGGLLYPNFQLLSLGADDYLKRMNIQEKLIQALDLRNHHKNVVTARMPVLNIFDPATAQAWLVGRKVIIESGRRFSFRIQYYASGFFALFLLISFLMGLLSSDAFGAMYF